ncbi:hypothetical protein [Sulfurospirillum barnesii]|uniref:Exporter n=1 Tax=Sulfurospirillum barnesii (strain ATCC 700032 / DSM 10660 / SES-3) TaxID=760154 RepID=I3XZZ6_SULBS|nr:hypothetical protein [Sulfurospirillum barnesii]AFL69520.1 hypothetical protein Sulba_2245 [Sulfurospirillum barnesii SES-3]
MKLWNKTLNILLFIAVLTGFFLLKERIHLSSNLSAFLPEGESKTYLDIYAHFNTTNEILIASEGFDKSSLQRIKAIESKLTRDHQLLLHSDITPNAKRVEYLKTYAFYTKAFQPKPTDDIGATLQRLHEAMVHNPFYTTIDRYDPLGYLSAPKENHSLMIKNGHLALGDFGYLAIFKPNPEHGLTHHEALYAFVHDALKGFENIRYFSPSFYFVENAKNIKDDVSLLVCISTFLLLLLYLVYIRNIFLLINTALSLASSVMLAFLVLSCVWSEISLFVLAFGSAMSTVAIDYMFHHYLHGHYSRKKGFNTAVFFGFLTTISGFFIFGWVNFLLIQQLCLFAILTLVFSYLHFAFLYPYMGFKSAPVFHFFKPTLHLPYPLITAISALILLGLIPFLKLDGNIRALDYHNQTLLSEEAFFKKNMKNIGTTPILIEARNIDDLVAKSRLIAQKSADAFIPLSFLLDEQSFQAQAKTLAAFDAKTTQTILQEEARKKGFREDFFKEAYSTTQLNPPFTPLNEALLKQMGLNVLSYQGNVYTLGMVKAADVPLLEAQHLAHSLEAQTLFSKALNEIHTELLWCGLLTMGLIVLILLRIRPYAFLLCLSFILFPLALILLSLWGTPLSLMHLFMLFIVMALSIDYGIYKAERTQESNATHNAIVLSLLSTFAGFGVLIFSRIGALEHIGWVASVGVIALFLLLLGREKQ